MLLSRCRALRPSRAEKRDTWGHASPGTVAGIEVEDLLKNGLQIQDEARQDGIGTDGAGSQQRLNRFARAIHMHGPTSRIDEPAELGPIADQLAQTTLQAGQAIRRRTELHREIWTERRKLLAPVRAERFPSFASVAKYRPRPPRTLG